MCALKGSLRRDLGALRDVRLRPGDVTVARHVWGREDWKEQVCLGLYLRPQTGRIKFVWGRRAFVVILCRVQRPFSTGDPVVDASDFGNSEPGPNLVVSDFLLLLALDYCKLLLAPFEAAFGAHRLPENERNAE